METQTKHIDASADTDLPPSTWADIVSAAELIAAELFPQGLVALRISTDSEIRRFNRDYRGEDSATDVLSFPSEEEEDEPELPAGESAHSGDLLISWDAVLRQARENGNSPQAEAIALIAHGMLHLAGWDHPDDEAQERMDIMTRRLCRLAGTEVESFGH